MNPEHAITIIEGLPPQFRVLYPSSSGVQESMMSDRSIPVVPLFFEQDSGKPFMTEYPEDGMIPAMVTMRSTNVPALIERCYQAWHNNEPIYLKYRTPHDEDRKVQIYAARNIHTPDGDVLVLNVLVPPDVYTEDIPPLEGTIF